MKSLKVLFEMFMPEARFPDEKFWDKDGNAIHPDPKGPPKGTVGKTQADFAPTGSGQTKRQGVGKKIVYFGYDPAEHGKEPEVPYEVSDEDDKRDPWNGGFPGAINAWENEIGVDAHEVGFWLDIDGSLNADYDGDSKREGGSWRWDGKTWEPTAF